MESLIVFLIALAASALTFFSGFGLGTILLPVFALFMPLTVAVAATAIVHLVNNLFKLAITFRYINWKITFIFGLPAFFAALAGAVLLSNLGVPKNFKSWEIFGFKGEITLIGLVIGSIIIVFAIFELLTNFKNIAIDKKWLPLGGLLSGFFGGLSGNQGALRSAFLIKTAISKEAFIATGVIIAVLVDLTRLSVYGTTFFSLSNIQQNNSVNLIIFAIFGGIVGALLGKALLPKVTFRLIQMIVAVLLLLAGFGIVLGIL